MAAVTTLPPRSGLKTRRSLCSVSSGRISPTPTSVAFSRNHSNRSAFLVGATAITSRAGSGSKSRSVSTTRTVHRRGPAAVRQQR